MITFCVALVCLILGYLIYGAFVEKVFHPNPYREAPSSSKNDGVDYIPMKTWKVFLIQFLNIAGTGPIFGAIMGVLFGPAAYLWIVLGCIFAGSVHDYMCGMICIRQDGASLPEIVGDNLGTGMRYVMRVLSLVLLVLVGAVFVTTPASLLDTLTPTNGFWGSNFFWVTVIFLYYIFATLLPIDKLIGKIYPLFGFALLAMAVGICYGIFDNAGYVPEITDAPFISHHPKGLPMFPMLCVTIACGAISGFHGTQSPLMARCIENEKVGRLVFYGAMITEGVVALIWAAAAIKFADALPGEPGQTAYEKLAAMGNPALVVKEISVGWLGKVGAVLAVLGVVAAPITSGDTAFRSARLIVADFMHVAQKKFIKRLLISIPMFLVATSLMFLNFDVLWRYFAWTNQTLACIMLWAATMYLAKNRQHWGICFVPAVFMTVVCTSYILIAPEGFSLPYIPGLIAAVVVAVVCADLALWKIWGIRKKSGPLKTFKQLREETDSWRKEKR